MIVMVRGAMGSGKSTIVRYLMTEHGAEPLAADLWQLPGDLRVLGRYRLTGASPGGGGDHIHGERVIEEAARADHLLWETPLGSQEMPSPEHRRLGVVWATLDTSFDQCIANIHRRREQRQRNVGRPLKVDYLRKKYARIEKTTARGAAEGYRVVGLQFEHSYDQLHDLLRGGGWECGCDEPVRWNFTETRSDPGAELAPGSGSLDGSGSS